MSLLVDDLKGNVFLDNLRVYRAWRARPVAIRETPIGEDALVRGRVETNGFVERTLVSEKECVANITTFRLAHWQYPNPGVQYLEIAGTAVARVRTTLPFFVIDALGDRLLVDDPDLIFRIAPVDVSAMLGYASRAGSPLQSFMRSRALMKRIDTEYYAQEQVVVPGQTVEVFGRVGTTTIHEQTAYRDAMTEVRTMKSNGVLSRVVVRSPPRA